MMWRIRMKTLTFELHELHYPALADDVEKSWEDPHIRTSWAPLSWACRWSGEFVRKPSHSNFMSSIILRWQMKWRILVRRHSHSNFMSSIILRWQMKWGICKKTLTFELHELHSPVLADGIRGSPFICCSSFCILPSNMWVAEHCRRFYLHSRCASLQLLLWSRARKTLVHAVHWAPLNDHGSGLLLDP